MTRWTLHCSRDVTVLIRKLGVDGHDLREAIKRLVDDPTPEFSRPLPERHNYYEIEVSGYWIGYQVVEEQRIIRVVLIEEMF